MINSKVKNSANFLRVKKIINEIDPIGIVYDGENYDEYDSEVEQILELLKNVKNESELAAQIQGVFIKMFDKKIASNLEPYNKIAKRILTGT